MGPREDGEVVIKQGDVGQDFYVIQMGEAKVTVREQGGGERHVLTLKAADYFGENALIRDEPRLATVTAITPLSLLTISRQDFKALGLNDKLKFQNRRAVAGCNAVQFKAEAHEPSPKTLDEKG